MEKEKQIEEMIKITDSHNCPKGQCFKFGYSCNRCKIETLVNAGYGNVKEAVKEFAERIKMAFYYEFDELIPSIMSDKIDEIAKEYGVEVEK